MILYKYDLRDIVVTKNGNGWIGAYEHTPDPQIKKPAVFSFLLWSDCTACCFCLCSALCYIIESYGLPFFHILHVIDSSVDVSEGETARQFSLLFVTLFFSKTALAKFNVGILSLLVPSLHSVWVQKKKCAVTALCNPTLWKTFCTFSATLALAVTLI